MFELHIVTIARSGSSRDLLPANRAYRRLWCWKWFVFLPLINTHSRLKRSHWGMLCSRRVEFNVLCFPHLCTFVLAVMTQRMNSPEYNNFKPTVRYVFPIWLHEVAANCWCFLRQEFTDTPRLLFSYQSDPTYFQGNRNNINDFWELIAVEHKWNLFFEYLSFCW